MLIFFIQINVEELKSEFASYVNLENLDDHLNIENDFEKMKFSITHFETENFGSNELFQISNNVALHHENKVPDLSKKFPKKNLNIENQKIKILEQLMKKNFSHLYKTKINKI